MPESRRTRLYRWAFNLFPAFFFTGARLVYLADDFHEARVELPLSWRTRNLVGTIFGGSLYASVDPFFMVMLLRILGRDFIVWDKAASIRFRRPGRGKLFARFLLPPDEKASIEAALQSAPSIDRVYHVDLVDAGGEVHASVDKTIYIRRKDSPTSARAAAPDASGEPRRA